MKKSSLDLLELETIRSLTELDALRYAELEMRMGRFEGIARDREPRTYPGYPKFPLPRGRLGLAATLAGALRRRRSERLFGPALPSLDKIAVMLGTFRTRGAEGKSKCQSAIPSPGGFAALEVYLLVLSQSGSGRKFIPPGVYHYDRREHQLSEIVKNLDAEEVLSGIPSRWNVKGSCIFGVVVADTRAPAEKYGSRSYAYLHHIAGALCQTFALAASTQRLGFIVLGGYLEKEIAGHLRLPASDAVLSMFACGEPAAGPVSALQTLSRVE